MNEIIKQVFVIRTLNEAQTDVVITVGKHLATKKHFKSKREAEDYMRVPKWDMIFALLSEVTTNIDKLNDGKTKEANR